MEEVAQLERFFTPQAFREVSAEIALVLQHREAIARTGRIPVPEMYPIKPPDEPILEITDGLQPGIYQIEGWVPLMVSGEAFIKVFRTDTGKRVYTDSPVVPHSVRLMGWSSETKSLFPYHSVITIKEGDWSHQYEARFELWHRTDSGTETKLLEHTRMIYGWQR
jgi:hypothetical protein